MVVQEIPSDSKWR